MYDSQILSEAIADYLYHCHNKPTRKGLADWLSISTQTVNNVVNGYFNGGFRYTDRPCATRIIANNDFTMIRALFKAGKDE